MIDLKKEYKTKDGHDVILMGIYQDSVIGIILWKNAHPSATTWSAENGIWWADDVNYNLVEVKHFTKNSIWVNVYNDGDRTWISPKHSTKENAIEAIFDHNYIKTIEITNEK